MLRRFAKIDRSAFVGLGVFGDALLWTSQKKADISVATPSLPTDSATRSNLRTHTSMMTMQLVAFRRFPLILLGTFIPVAMVASTAAAQVVGGTISGAANRRPPANLSFESTPDSIDSRQVKKLPLNGRIYDQFILLNPPEVDYNGQLLSIDSAREFNVATNTYSAYYGKRTGAQIGVVTTSGTNQLHGDVFEHFGNSIFDARNYFDSARIPNLQRNDFGGSLGGPLWKKKLFFFTSYEGYRQNLGLTDVTLVPDNEARAGFLPDANGVEKPVAINPVSARLLNLWPVQNGPEGLNDGRLTGIAEAFSNPEQHVRVDSGTTRMDAKLTTRDTASASYTIDDSTAETPEQNPYSIDDEALREQSLSIEEQHAFTPHVLNTARFTFSRNSSFFNGYVRPDIQAITPTFIPGEPTGSVVISASVSSGGAAAITRAGTTTASNNSVSRNSFTYDDHIALTLGKHQIEAGIWLQRLQSNDNLSQEQYGQAAFNSLTNFFAGTIRLFHYAPNSTPLNWRDLFADAYLEDTFHLAPRFLVRAGFRSDSSSGWSEAHGRAGVYSVTDGILSTNATVQSHIVDDNRALFLPEPRLGFTWDVFGDGKTNVRGGAGLYHSPLEALDYRLDEAAPFNTAYAYNNSSVAAATGTAPLVLPSSVDTSIATPALFAYSLKIEQQVASKTFLTVGYVGSHRYHQILAGDLNEPPYTVLANNVVYYPTTTKSNPDLASTLSWWSGGTGSYNALAAELRQDVSHGFHLRASYTWSKNLDDGAAWTTSVSANTPAFVEVPSLPKLDYGPSATDIRDVATVDANYDLPFGKGRAFFANSKSLTDRLVSGWSLSTIGNLQSGLPFSPQLGYNPTASGDPRNPVRPDVNPDFHGQLYTRGTTAQRVAQFYNPTAFSPPAYGTVGNARRDSLVGPGHANWDLALMKSTPLTERTNLQFRAEFYNVFNHTNLQVPNEIVYTNGPAQGTASAQTTAVALGPGGVITSTADSSRQIQLSLKLGF
jgi:hypothetical protein